METLKLLEVLVIKSSYIVLAFRILPWLEGFGGPEDG